MTTTVHTVKSEAGLIQRDIAVEMVHVASDENNNDHEHDLLAEGSRYIEFLRAKPIELIKEQIAFQTEMYKRADAELQHELKWGSDGPTMRTIKIQAVAVIEGKLLVLNNLLGEL